MDAPEGPGRSAVQVPPSGGIAAPATPGSRFGRRWDDHRPVLPEADFGDFLASRPSLTSTLHYLTALLSWPVGATTAALHRKCDERFVQIATFSINSAVEDPETSELTELRLTECFGASGAARMASWVDEGPSRTSTVHAWLLGSPANPWGALTVHVSVEIPDRFLRDHLTHLVDLLSLYLATEVPADAEVVALHTAESVAREHLLTERQRLVLRLLADSMTMRQIALRIGYSESTVRAEALVVYRKLAVHTREQAVAVARALGLLT